MKTTKSAFTLIELAATIVIIGIIVAAAFPFVSKYTDWAKQRSDIRTVNLVNDAIDRYRAAQPDDEVFVGSNYPTENGPEQNAAVLAALTNGSINTYIPGDRFLSLAGKTPAQMASKFLSDGSGTGFRFYDYNADGNLIGIYVGVP